MRTNRLSRISSTAPRISSQFMSNLIHPKHLTHVVAGVDSISSSIAFDQLTLCNSQQ